MRRRLDGSLAGVLVVLVVIGALRCLDVTAYPLVMLQTAGPFVVMGLVLLALAIALLRRWWLLVPAGIAALVSLAMVLPAFFSSASPKATKELTVMAANLSTGRADPDQLMDAVRARTVDVLVLEEVTPDAVEQLRAAGLDDYFPHDAGQTRPDSVDGTVVYSRLPLEEVSDAAEPGSASLEPDVRVKVNGAAVRLKAVHVVTPFGGEVGPWRDELRELAAWPDRLEGPLVMAGDFEADQGHPAFRAVADGLTDGHRAAGLGWVRTWPVVGQRLPPYVQLDHLLTRGLTVVEAGQVAIHGADHAIVWASYALTRGG